jgi:hypothetical protein
VSTEDGGAAQGRTAVARLRATGSLKLTTSPVLAYHGDS